MRTIMSRRSPRVTVILAVALALLVPTGCEVTGERPADAPPLVVGLLLPLSGEHAALGHTMFDAAQMALQRDPAAQIEIVPQDTKGTPEGARPAAQSALDAGAQLLVGPVYRGNVGAVVPLARRAGVDVVTFSNDPELSSSGVFVFGLGPEQKIARLAELAGERGLDRVALFAPDTAYSRLILELVRREESAGRLAVTDVILYPPPTSFPAMAPLVADLYRNWEDNGAPAMVLLPMDGHYLAAVAQMFRGAGAPPQLVSLDLKEPVFNPIGDLDGIWYVFPAGDRVRQRLARHSSETLGRRLGWMELMAYDAVAVIAERAAAAGSPPSPVRMTEARAYAGASGLFQFLPEGHVQRALAVKAVGRKRPSVVSPAPPTLAPRIAATTFAAPMAKPDDVGATGAAGARRATGGP
jgi:branched-chain amino acid transport system substrate-binding protein